MDERDLYEVPAQRHSATSVAAAAGVAPVVTTRREEVYEIIAQFGAAGCSDNQVEAVLIARGRNLNGHRARRQELEKAGRVHDVGLTADGKATRWSIYKVEPKLFQE